MALSQDGTYLILGGKNSAPGNDQIGKINEHDGSFVFKAYAGQNGAYNFISLQHP